MNAIVTVIGQDRVGIIAAVCGKLAELNVNILDITQTILKGNFTMVMTVDAGQANVGFEQLAAGLEALGSRWAWSSASSGMRSLTPCTGSEGGEPC